MASLPNYFPLFLLASLALTQARNTQFFSKVSATNNNLDPPNYTPEDPKLFFPENGNGYGLYRHVSGQEQEPEPEQLPQPNMATTEPSTATDQSIQKAPDFEPKNYNPVEHLIKPEDLTAEAFIPVPETNNYYNGVASSFNSQPDDGLSWEQYMSNGGGFRQQGMSDTRFLENGKYFYDVSTDRYSSNHPYERLRGARNDYKNMDYYNYGNSGDAYEFGRENPMWGNQNHDEEDRSIP